MAFIKATSKKECSNGKRIAATFLLLLLIVGIGFLFGLGVIDFSNRQSFLQKKDSFEEIRGGIFGTVGEFHDKRNPDGTVTTSLVLTPTQGSGVDGKMAMTVFAEPAETIWARLESEAVMAGWVEIHSKDAGIRNARIFHHGGEIRIMAVNTLGGDLNAVSIYTGKMATR